MRWWAPLVLLPSLACAPEPVVNCVCISPGVPRERLEGGFVHTLESVEVRAGGYVPPALPASTPALGLSNETFFSWLLVGEDALIVRTDWIDARADPAADGGCCPGWDGLALTSPQPAWNARNRARLDAMQELGAFVTELDPTLAYVEPVLFEVAVDGSGPRPFELDADERGFVLRADYLVTPDGCTEPSCTAVIRLTHHLRRPD